jgi:PTS system cellobiose-specific IIA component
MENLEVTIMNLIVDSGGARSFAMEAIGYAKANQMEEADKALQEANEQLVKAHNSQTALIHQEAGGDPVPLSLLMVHAQDHLMTSMVVRDLATEMIDLYKRIEEK